MNNRTFFSGNAKQYAEWIKDNLSEICQKCGWGETNNTSNIEVFAESGSEVARLVIMNEHNCVTEIMCEANGTIIPLAAAMKAMFAIGASMETGQLRNDAKTKRRWVVAAPCIDDVLIRVMQEERLPIHFLQVRPGESESKYWESKITPFWK